MEGNVDHSQCTEKQTAREVEHTCPPCEHGLERGGTWRVTGDAWIDGTQRRLKMHAIDELSCTGPYHAEVMARRDASRQ
jgi:hypothetical protein